MHFGISTHLFHHEPLSEAHVAEVARHGFETLELFATRTHFDYHDPAAIQALAGWLRDAGIRLHSVHAPITDGFVDGVWGATLSTGVSDAVRRGRAVKEAQAALAIADVVPFSFLVVHLGVPADQRPEPNDNNRDAARRSVEEIHAAASARGVRLALEVIPNRLSTVEALRRLIDDELELPDAGLCLDFGHANLVDDPVDAVEEASGHLFTTHVHDNRGRTDDHLVPFEGTIDWPRAVFAAQKVGYDGVWMFEVANTGTAADVLEKTRRAARRFEDLLVS